MKPPRTAKRKAAQITALIAASLLTGTAYANFSCSGKIQFLGVNPDGTIYIDVGFGVWNLCNTSTAFQGNNVTFTADGCKAWYAGILASQKANQSIRLYFTAATSGDNVPQCAALGSWVVPNPSPYHFQVTTD
jgi:hypothetical protein